MLFPKPHQEMTDSELIEFYRKTDEMEVVGILYKRYTSLAYGVCLKYLKDREVSKDAVMQVFEKLLTSLKVHDITHFKSWLYVTVRNHCLMEIRAQKGKHFEEISPILMESNGEMHLEEGIELETNLTQLEKCMEEMVSEQKDCVQLFYIQQKCYKEITDITGFDYNHVKSYIQNGKRNLKLCIERNG
jgi:RNA polymerase sigma-70 factor (ECF subfamily)